MKNNLFKFLEILPVIVFFIFYKYSNLFMATSSIIISSVAVLFTFFIFKQKISTSMLLSTALIVVFGGITVVSNNSMFIKIKPTILYLLFCMFFIYDLRYKKHFFKNTFNDVVELSTLQSNKLSKNCIYFFLFCALLNEVVWRNFSESTWVSFKVFGFTGLTFTFMLLQFTRFQRSTKKEAK